jgi:hypothetical protein
MSGSELSLSFLLSAASSTPGSSVIALSRTAMPMDGWRNGPFALTAHRVSITSRPPSNA